MVILQKNLWNHKHQDNDDIFFSKTSKWWKWRTTGHAENHGNDQKKTKNMNLIEMMTRKISWTWRKWWQVVEIWKWLTREMYSLTFNNDEPDENNEFAKKHAENVITWLMNEGNN